MKGRKVLRVSAPMLMESGGHQLANRASEGSQFNRCQVTPESDRNVAVFFLNDVGNVLDLANEGNSAL